MLPSSKSRLEYECYSETQVALLWIIQRSPARRHFGVEGVLVECTQRKEIYAGGEQAEALDTYRSQQLFLEDIADVDHLQAQVVALYQPVVRQPSVGCCAAQTWDDSVAVVIVCGPAVMVILFRIAVDGCHHIESKRPLQQEIQVESFILEGGV